MFLRLTKQKSRHTALVSGEGVTSLGPPGARIREPVTASQIYCFHTEGVGVHSRTKWALVKGQHTGPCGPGLGSSAAPAGASHSQDQRFSGFAWVLAVIRHEKADHCRDRSFEAADLYSFGLEEPDGTPRACTSCHESVATMVQSLWQSSFAFRSLI